jgi:hypothetical protein
MMRMNRPPPMPPMFPPPLPPGPPPGPCEIVKREDGVVVARAFGAEIVQVNAEGAVFLSRPLDPSGTPRCDTEVLEAFNWCLKKIGLKLSASPVVQSEWSISEGKRLSRFSDGVIVPPPLTPGPGRGLAMMMTVPVGSGRRGGGRGRGGYRHAHGGSPGRGGRSHWF